MKSNYSLDSKDQLTILLNSKGINTWSELTDFVQKLPYGRNSNRKDVSLVLKEEKGSCSSKHAFLKKIAELNNLVDCKLYLGIYKMNNVNTPNIGFELIDNQIDYIPEAHCYLSINGQKHDFTSVNSSFSKIENDIITEIEISIEQVDEYKVEFHKNYLRNWVKKSQPKFDFEEIWRIREKCIRNLSYNGVPHKMGK